MMLIYNVRASCLVIANKTFEFEYDVINTWISPLLREKVYRICTTHKQTDLYTISHIMIHKLS